MAHMELHVEFLEHIAAPRVSSLVTGIAAYGNVVEGEHPGTFRVSVFRTSKLPQLEQQLATWERHGFLRWQRAALCKDFPLRVKH